MVCIISRLEDVHDEWSIAHIGKMIEPWGDTGQEGLEGLLIPRCLAEEETWANSPRLFRETR